MESSPDSYKIPLEETPIYDQLRYEYYLQEDLDAWFGPNRYRKGLHTT